MLKPRIATLEPKIKPMTGGGWRAGKTTTSRGYGYRWQQLRALFLRANPVCVYCEREGRLKIATVVDHITPHRGDDRLFWDQANWQSLCKHCHDSIKAKEERMQERV